MEVAPFFVDFHHFLSIFTIFYRFSRFTHFCRDLHFVAIYALFPQFFFGQNSLLRNITRFLNVWMVMVMMMMSMMELVASKRSMMHWGLCQPHQCNHPFSPKLAQRVLLNFCRIGFSQWTFSGGRICKQGQLSKRSREIHDVFLY